MARHPRQYVIGPLPWEAAPGWSSRGLPAGLYLSHAPDTPVLHATDADGAAWWVVGVTVPTTQPGFDAAATIGRAATGEVSAHARTWAGRWLLIGNDRIITDPGALAGCLYRTVESGPSAGVWLSGSPALLASIPNAPPATRNAVDLVHAPRRGLDWYPCPATGFREIARLLPSQQLALSDLHSGPRARLLMNGVVAADYEACLETLERVLTTTMRNLAMRHPGALWLALSGGWDSRLLLATAVASGVEARCYTFGKTYPAMSTGDRWLPPRLARMAGFRHSLIRARPASQRRYRQWDRHTAGHTVGVDRHYYGHGQWDAVVRTTSTVVRGGVFELGRAHYWDRLPAATGNDPDEIVRLVRRGFRMHLHQAASAGHTTGLRRWAEWAATHREALDWRDRFYWEQRIASWLAAIEQGLDLTSVESVVLANSGECIGALLGVPAEVRVAGGPHRDLIERMSPQLLRLPVNPPDARHLTAARTLRQRLRRVRRRLPGGPPDPAS